MKIKLVLPFLIILLIFIIRRQENFIPSLFGIGFVIPPVNLRMVVFQVHMPLLRNIIICVNQHGLKTEDTTSK